MAVDLASRGFSFAILVGIYQYRLISWQHTALYWLLLLIGIDFLFYWLHRIDHTCCLFWAIHVTHHSSEEFNLTVGFRSSVFQPIYRFVYFMPLALAGFAPADILLIYATCQIYGILLHTKCDFPIGKLDLIFTTPSQHRVHHGSNSQYLDRNMGMVLIVWDRLFGTFTRETDEVTYGLTHALPKRDPLRLIFHEWSDLRRDVVHAKSLKSKIQVIFGRPSARPTPRQ